MLAVRNLIKCVKPIQLYRDLSVTSRCFNMDLTKIVSVLNEIAPVKYAADWDNVGLLLEPSAPCQVSRIMLTNDLTEPVLEECLKKEVGMIVSYHPPIFKSYKRLSFSDWKSRIIVKALENRLAVYSPHTACDAVQNGVNDWLAQCLGELEFIKPVAATEAKPLTTNIVSFKLDLSDKTAKNFFDYCSQNISNVNGDTLPGGLFQCKFECNDDNLKQIYSYGEMFSQNLKSWQVTKLSPIQLPTIGIGRICRLQSPVAIIDLIDQIKNYIGIPHLRLALGNQHILSSMIQTVALCAGSGSSVLKGIKADLYLTGEMSHHDALDAVSNNVSVILCEHSNTERGYLKVLKQQLVEKLSCVEILISEMDKDPLVVT